MRSTAHQRAAACGAGGSPRLLRSVTLVAAVLTAVAGLSTGAVSPSPPSSSPVATPPSPSSSPAMAPCVATAPPVDLALPSPVEWGNELVAGECGDQCSAWDHGSRTAVVTITQGSTIEMSCVTLTNAALQSPGGSTTFLPAIFTLAGGGHGTWVNFTDVTISTSCWTLHTYQDYFCTHGDPDLFPFLNVSAKWIHISAWEQAPVSAANLNITCSPNASDPLRTAPCRLTTASDVSTLQQAMVTLQDPLVPLIIGVERNMSLTDGWPGAGVTVTGNVSLVAASVDGDPWLDFGQRASAFTMSGGGSLTMHGFMLYGLPLKYLPASNLYREVGILSSYMWPVVRDLNSPNTSLVLSNSTLLLANDEFQFWQTWFSTLMSPLSAMRQQANWTHISSVKVDPSGDDYIDITTLVGLQMSCTNLRYIIRPSNWPYKYSILTVTNNVNVPPTIVWQVGDSSDLPTIFWQAASDDLATYVRQYGVFMVLARNITVAHDTNVPGWDAIAPSSPGGASPPPLSPASPPPSRLTLPPSPPSVTHVNFTLPVGAKQLTIMGWPRGLTVFDLQLKISVFRPNSPVTLRNLVLINLGTPPNASSHGRTSQLLTTGVWAFDLNTSRSSVDFESITMQNVVLVVPQIEVQEYINFANGATPTSGIMDLTNLRWIMDAQVNSSGDTWVVFGQITTTRWTANNINITSTAPKGSDILPIDINIPAENAPPPLLTEDKGSSKKSVIILGVVIAVCSSILAALITLAWLRWRWLRSLCGKALPDAADRGDTNSSPPVSGSAWNAGDTELSGVQVLVGTASCQQKLDTCSSHGTPPSEGGPESHTPSGKLVATPGGSRRQLSGGDMSGGGASGGASGGVSHASSRSQRRLHQLQEPAPAALASSRSRSRTGTSTPADSSSSSNESAPEKSAAASSSREQRSAGRDGTTGTQGSSGAKSDDVSGSSPEAELRKLMMLSDDIKDRQLEVQQSLGWGGYSVVYKGTWKGLPVAVKVVLIQGDQQASQRHLLEAAISSSLVHPNIVATYAYDLKPLGAVEHMAPREQEIQLEPSGLNCYQLFIVQEYCTLGTLKSAVDQGWLHIQPQGTPDLNAVLHIAEDVATGLQHIHTKNIIHGDLSPSNVLLQSHSVRPQGYIAKVADFGLSVRMEEGHTHRSCAYQGTPHYIAPEIISKGILGRPADVYAYGVLLWELYNGPPPWRSTHRMPGVMGPAGRGDPVDLHTFPATCPTLYSQLAKDCLEEDSAARPTFSDICRRLQDMRTQLQGKVWGL